MPVQQYANCWHVIALNCPEKVDIQLIALNTRDDVGDVLLAHKNNLSIILH